MKNLTGAKEAHRLAVEISNHPLVEKSWTFRGQVCLLTRSREAFQNFLVLKRTDSGKYILKSKWTDPVASAKQEEASNARDTKKLVELHYKHLQKSLALEGECDDRLDLFLSDEERCEIEDELDKFNPSDLSVPLGYAGCIYRDDFCQPDSRGVW